MPATVARAPIAADGTGPNPVGGRYFAKPAPAWRMVRWRAWPPVPRLAPLPPDASPRRLRHPDGDRERPGAHRRIRPDARVRPGPQGQDPPDRAAVGRELRATRP